MGPFSAQGLLANFAQSTGVWTVGEVLDNMTTYVGDYTSQSLPRIQCDAIWTDYLDSVLDYPAYFAVTAAGRVMAALRVCRG